MKNFKLANSISIAIMYKWNFNSAIMKLPSTGKHYFLSCKFMYRIFSFLLTFFFLRKEKRLCAFFVTFFAQAKKVMNKNRKLNINFLPQYLPTNQNALHMQSVFLFYFFFFLTKNIRSSIIRAAAVSPIKTGTRPIPPLSSLPSFLPPDLSPLLPL